MIESYKRPFMNIPDGVSIRDVFFPDKHVHISNDHSEGYWLLFRKTIWKLDHDFIAEVTLSNGIKFRIIIKAGFMTDLASTPKAMWWLYPPFDEHWGAAALLHDILYAAEIFKKHLNDECLRVGMKVSGASKMTRFNFYTAVKCWGWTVYRKHAEKNIIENRKFVDIETISL